MHKQPHQNKEFHIEGSTLSLSEAAVFLGISKNTLLNYDSQQLLVPTRDLRDHRTYTRAQLQSFKDSRHHTTASAAAALGISTSKLRKLEANASINVPRDSSNRRQYSNQLLKEIRQVLTDPTKPSHANVSTPTPPTPANSKPALPNTPKLTNVPSPP